MIKMNHVSETTESCLQFQYARLCVVIQSSLLPSYRMFLLREEFWTVATGDCSRAFFHTSDPLPVRERRLPQCQGPVKSKPRVVLASERGRHYPLHLEQKTSQDLTAWKSPLKTDPKRAAPMWHNNTDPQSRSNPYTAHYHTASVGKQPRGRPDWVVTREERLWGIWASMGL